MRKVGLGETGGTALTGGGIIQGDGIFLQGGGSGYSIAWVGDVINFGGNGEEVRRDTNRVPATDHREESNAVKRKDMGDVGGGRRTRGSGNAVGEDLHRETAGFRVSVCGATPLILYIYKGNRVQRRREQEGGVVAPRGDIKKTSSHSANLAVR